MLLELEVYVEVTQITNSKMGGGGWWQNLKEKEKLCKFFAEVCWIFVPEGYIR